MSSEIQVIEVAPLLDETIRVQLEALAKRAAELGALETMTDAEYDESAALAGRMQAARKAIEARHKSLKAPLTAAGKKLDAAKAELESALTAAQAAHAPGHTRETTRRQEEVRRLQAERDLADRQRRDAERAARDEQVRRLQAENLLAQYQGADPLGLNLAGPLEPAPLAPIEELPPLPDVPAAPKTAYATRRVRELVIDSPDAIPWEVDGPDGVTYRLQAPDAKAIKEAIEAGAYVPGARIVEREVTVSTGRV